MKSLIAVLIALSLALGVFSFSAPTTNATLHETMSASEHTSMSSDCGSSACTTTQNDCASMCFVASGFKVDAGMLPGSSLPLLVLALAAILALRFGTTNTSRLAFKPIAYRDPHLLLTTHKRE